MEREFPGNGGTVQFSPDGRWFVVGGENSRFYSIADWSCHKTLPGTVAFSPDGRLLVLGVGDHSFSLRDTKSDRELARFEDPNQHLAENFLFSPDGTRLVTIDRNNKAVHVWDLRAIRRQLADRNLDWDTTPDPPAAAADPLVQIRIDMGDYLSMSPRTLAASYDRTVEAGRHLVWRWYYRGKFHLSAGRYESGVTDLRTAVELSPNFDEACNALAWVYATGPDKLRDPVRAVVLGERAVKLRPEIPDYSNTLGIAYYRASRFPEAVTTLTKSLHAGSGQADAYDLYFLALCHHQMGNRAEARDCLDRARTWHKSQQGRLSAEQVDELNRFRTEAEEGTRTDARPSPSATKQ